MTAAVRISRKAAGTALDALLSRGAGPAEQRAIRELERALTPRPRSSQVRKTEAKRGAKRLSTKEVRAAVMERANNRCECGCGRWFRGFGGRATLDHFFGKARAESVETCWALREDCHRLKTDNFPDAKTWLRRFIAHCDRHGYSGAREGALRRLDSLIAIQQAADLTRRPA